MELKNKSFSDKLDEFIENVDGMGKCDFCGKSTIRKMEIVRGVELYICQLCRRYRKELIVEGR